MIPQLSRFNLIFPDPKDADDKGVLAHSDDLNINRIMERYTNVHDFVKRDDLK
ncbi:MAG: hypothetical protein U9Q33_12695 [Campylobacterota bacterium]|nr:hypothetical protein [Campylobacterota bacterium]